MSVQLQIAEGVLVDDGAILGYGASRSAPCSLVLGPGSRLRTGTVIYSGSVIGVGFETGHNVIVREDNTIGDHVSIWSNSVIDYGCSIGHRVKIHSNCYIAQYTEIEDDVFLAPGVTIANDLVPGNPDSAKAMAGPLIQAGAQIGVNVTILPYVKIGYGALIGAGSVVTKDVPPGAVVYGNPGRVHGRVEDLGDVAARVELARAIRTDGGAAQAVSEQ
jgi:acetyltransferase-like isoleucine patch superfamily enzyme